MTETPIGRPNADEHSPYYAQYIALVPDGDIVETLTRQIAATEGLCASLTPEQAQRRDAPEAWNAAEVIGHLADTERVFAYRILRFARADATPLEGVETFDPYVTHGGFTGRDFAGVVAEYAAVRGATLALLRGLDAAAWARRGVADGNTISVRALAYIAAGHELHHRRDLEMHLTPRPPSP